MIQREHGSDEITNLHNAVVRYGEINLLKAAEKGLERMGLVKVLAFALHATDPYSMVSTVYGPSTARSTTGSDPNSSPQTTGPEQLSCR